MQAWDGNAFANKMRDRIVDPAVKAKDLLDILYTTRISSSLKTMVTNDAAEQCQCGNFQPGTVIPQSGILSAIG